MPPLDATLLRLQRIAGNAALARARDRAPNDRPAAPANAAGPVPARRAGGAPGRPPATRNAVQRAVWIEGDYVEPTDTRFSRATPRMREWLADSGIRDYQHEDEFRRHAAGKTDYLGNLEDGTWLRFSATQLNVVGEDHTGVTLPDILRAVGGTKSYIYELFPSDKLPPRMRSAFVESGPNVLADLGVGPKDSLRAHGAESIYPKLGYIMTLLKQQLDTFRRHGLEPRDRDNKVYGQKPVQRGLSYAFAFAQDTRARRDGLKNRLASRLSTRHRRAEAADRQLIDVFGRHERLLMTFEATFRPGGYLNDTLLSWRERYGAPGLDALTAALDDFADAAMPAFRQYQQQDDALSDDDRRRLAGAPTPEKEFGDWRNMTFRQNARAAVRSGKRYAGMGENHRGYLEGAGLGEDERVKFFVHPRDFVRADEFTEIRRKQLDRLRNRTAGGPSGSGRADRMPGTRADPDGMEFSRRPSP